MSRTFRSYAGTGSPGVKRMGLTSFLGAGEPGTKSQNVQVSVGRFDFVGLEPDEIEAVRRGLENRAAVKVQGAGNAEPLRVRPVDEDYEALVSVGAPDGVDDIEAGTFIRLTKPQVEDLVETLGAVLEGEEWTSPTSWESFVRIEEDGEQTEMYELDQTMEEYEQEVA